MMRLKNTLVLAAMVTAVVLPSATSAHATKSLIKGTEVGYFGSATVTYGLSVFVYSNVGPRAGNHVTVCMRGTCKAAVGHTARLDWYSASFRTPGLRMGDTVRYTVVASDAGRTSRATVAKQLLCMHNNGSVPQN